MTHPKFLNTLGIMNYKILQFLVVIVSLNYSLNIFGQGIVTRPAQQSQNCKPIKSANKVSASEPDGYINGSRVC